MMKDNMKRKNSDLDIASIATSATSLYIDSDDDSQDMGGDGGMKHRLASTKPFVVDIKSSVNSSNGAAAAAAAPTHPAPEEMIVLGCDLSHYSPKVQFIICTVGVFGFNMLYGALQELIQIQIAGRKFALFLAASQFAGYAFWSAVLSKLRTYRLRKNSEAAKKNMGEDGAKPENICLLPKSFSTYEMMDEEKNATMMLQQGDQLNNTYRGPLSIYIALSIIRAIDLGLTNLSMKFINYPAKTLMKSSRVIFTMLLGSIIGRKSYKKSDYAMCVLLVTGLCIFFRADMNTDAVFHPYGVMMLATSLALDATVSNSSEHIMKRYSIGQDEFQMQLFFLSFLVMLFVSHFTNELVEGLRFFLIEHGTVHEFESTDNHEYWTPFRKTFCLFLFGTMGTFGGSCACAITRRFGALNMAIVTTSRKAATLCLSFLIFPNICSVNHALGMTLFISGLFVKSIVRSGGKKSQSMGANNNNNKIGV